MNKAARNERAKLTATWLNGVSIAAVAVGGIGPTVAVIIGTVPPPVIRDVLLAGIAWLLLALSLHMAGRMILRRIEE
jgi:hypothetical protein